MKSRERTDIAIIGGGYYGTFIASEIKSRQPDLDVAVLEKESAPFSRAASTNQGRFHRGYLYSADPTLAAECAENIGIFNDEFGNAVDRGVKSLYGIPQDSEISPEDYIAFCERLNLPLIELDRPTQIFGEPVVATFETEETTFNGAKLQEIFLQRMNRTGARMLTDFGVDRITTTSSGLEMTSGNRIVTADTVFNVTYADINDLHERSGLPKIPLRHDTFLHFVVDLPSEYQQTAATVIRGQYAMLLPSTFRQGHILVSDRHSRISSTLMDNPPLAVDTREAQAIYEQAKRETTIFMPLLTGASYRDYTLGTRTALFDEDPKKYSSKARVFENYSGLPNYHTVLSGKVSNVLDMREPIRRIVR